MNVMTINAGIKAMNSTPIRKHRQRGLTLVELMIAMVLGLIVLGGVVQVFLGGRLAYGEVQRFTALQETTGFLSDFMAGELRGVDSVALVNGRLEVTTESDFGCSAYFIQNNAFRCDGAGGAQPILGGADIRFTAFNVQCIYAAVPVACAANNPRAVVLTFGIDSQGPDGLRPLTFSLTYALRNNIL
jgi:type IV pilus assembly protein PilW